MTASVTASSEASSLGAHSNCGIVVSYGVQMVELSLAPRILVLDGLLLFLLSVS